ncbi:MAG TPA: 1-deoxy-D-xylulose-5-phosphate synthase [Bacillota bacterium]|nr:1-deoxy-D-xylulose-5-phosphate synthase [Bacillota bacterium]
MARLLDSLDLPKALKHLTLGQLQQVAGEIREEIIDTVSKTGGHLASSLGVVELALAIHTVLDSPYDKVIWDVGHQAYAHKILTGRLNEFSSLRQYGGISGFPRTDESPHDIYNTGHSSTSISIALGIAKARDLKDENYSVLAVIGDGSLTGGMAFEALNHAGQLGTSLIVVLNDNEMSISRNVGGLASYLSRIRTEPHLLKARRRLERIIKNIPIIGKDVSESVRKLKGSLKYLVIPSMLFEDLGFTYLGPLDGHDIPLLIRTIQQAKAKGGPVLIHAVTKKGKGYPPAEKDPRAFHGVGKFHVPSGKMLVSNGSRSLSEIFGEAVVKAASKDPRIIAITAAMPDGTGLNAFMKAYPNRFFDVGIAEQHAVTMAGGLASQGFIPVVAVYSTFLQRAYDQIVHDIALQGLHVVFAVDRAGLVGEDGPTHHGNLDIAFLRSIPGMTVMAPMDEHELVSMLDFALHMQGPCALRYPRSSAMGKKKVKACPPIEYGRGLLVENGKDVAIIALGSMVDPSLDAVGILRQEGLSATLVNARFAKPVDESLILEVSRKCKKVLVVEEASTIGGLGNAVSDIICNKIQEKVDFAHLGIPDDFVTHGPREILLAECGLSAMGIAEAAFRMCKPRGAISLAHEVSQSVASSVEGVT